MWREDLATTNPDGTITMTQEELRALSDTSRTTSGSIRSLGTMADRAGGALGGLVRGVPKQLSDFTEGVEKLIGTNSRFTNMMKFAESYIGVWQGLTKYGVNFGNQLDEMIIRAGRANLNMADLAKVVSENSRDLAGLGGTAQAGIDDFIRRQGRFFQQQERDFTGVQRQMMLLGLTVDDINNRFLSTDILNTIRNRQDALVGEARNRSAMAFTEEMDKLAKLTGKQADQLAKEQLEIARQGNVYAAEQMLPENTRDQISLAIGRMADFGDTARKMSTDILTRGFIDPNDPAVVALHSFAPDVVNSLYKAREAMQRGDRAESERLRGLAAEQMASLQRDRNFQQQAILGGVNEYSRGIMEVMTSMNRSAQVLSQGALEAELRRNGIEVNAENLQRLREQKLAENTAAQQANNQGLVAAYNEAIIALQSGAKAAQERIVTGFSSIGTTASAELIRQIRGIDLAAMAHEFSNVIGGAVDWSQTGKSITGVMSEQQDLLTQAARSTTDEARRIQLRDASTAIGAIRADLESANPTMTEEAARARVEEIMRNANLTTATLNANQVRVDATSAIINSALPPTQGTTSPGQAIGTFGNFNSLFRDFGSESMVPLHNIEAVLTPRQMGDVVQNASAGTMRAFVQELNQSRDYTPVLADMMSSINITLSSLDGKLNTLRMNIRESAPVVTEQNMSVEVRTAITEAMSKMPESIKRSFEDAVKGTLSAPITQLVELTRSGAEYHERVARNTDGISSDYMRGA